VNLSTKKLKDFLSEPIKNGYSPVCVDEPTSRKVLGLGALNGLGLNLNETKWVSESNTQVDKYQIKPGDFLVSRSNTLDKVGRAALYTGGLENCSYPDLMMKFRVDEKKIDPHFLEIILQSHRARKHFMRCASGTSESMVKITKSVVESIEIPHLPMEVQKHIVNLSCTWKDAIEKAERLIAAKRKRFDWLMRTLIIDQCSLSNKICIHKKLADIADIKKGEQLNRTELLEVGDYPAWNGGICPSGYTDKWNTEGNTVTISEGGNSCGFVSFAIQRFWCGGHCYALLNVSDSVSPEYLYFYLKVHEKHIMRLRVGSGLPNIQRKDIEKFIVSFPEKNLQQKIAKTLSIAKEEINLLEKLAEKYRTQKRGLMQKLLTGEWQVNTVKEVA
jgi:type I restriction enzyme S subunit